MTLLALAMVGALRFWGPKDDLRRATANNGNAQVATAIDRYVTANGSLPCPDVTGNGTAGSSCGTATTPTWGLVPWQTLGLSPQQALDAWGRRLTYALASNSNNVAYPYACNAAAAANSGGGLATWSNLTPSPGGSAYSSAAYVLVNHGPNGRGAFQQNGASIGGQLSVPSAANEAFNCPRSASTGTTNQCPSVSNDLYWPGPYVAKGSDTSTWFDDTVMAGSGQPYGCLCIQPTISTTINSSTGVVTATASLTSPPTCDTVWTTSIGQQPAATTPWYGWANNCAGYLASTALNVPITTRAGGSCTVTASFNSTISSATIAAGNLGNIGWQTGIPATPVSKTYLKSGLTAATTATTASAGTPAMSDMGFTTGSGNVVTSCAKCTDTPTSASGVKTISYTDGTDTITITGAGGGDGNGYLCYDPATETLGVTHTTGCYLGGATGDSLTIGLSATFTSYSAVLDFEVAGSEADITEQSGSKLCDDAYTCSTNPHVYPETSSGYLIIPWQDVTETPTAGGGATLFPFNRLVIAPNSGIISTGVYSQIGFSQIVVGK